MKIVYIYGLWLDGHIRYLGSSRRPNKRFRELALGINRRVKSLIAQGARLVVLQAIPERGSEPVLGRMIQAFKRVGDCGCNDRIPKKPRSRDVTWRGRLRWLKGGEPYQLAHRLNTPRAKCVGCAGARSTHSPPTVEDSATALPRPLISTGSGGARNYA
jgi:hypothetical protein